MTKGSDFLAEAERLKDLSQGQPLSLAMLQGTLLLYERLVFLLSFLSVRLT